MKSNKCVVILSVLTLWILSALSIHAQIVLDAAGTNLTSTAISSGTYSAGQNIDISVGWNKNVPLVSGSPTIDITVGSTVYQANYVSGSGTGTWIFRYTVQSGDTDTDGVTLAANINLNGGNIGGADTNLKTTSFGSVLVDTTPPTVSSVTGPANGTYIVGGNLNFTVNTSEKVNVTGSPQIALTLNSGTVNATYVSGSGTTALTFRYTVQSGDSDPDGVALGNSISLNGGTIADLAGNAMTSFTFTAPTTTGVLIDGVPPAIQISAPSASYTRTASVTYTVTYSDSNFSSSSLAANKITLNKTGTASGNVGVSGSGTSYTVTISSISGDGTLGISIASGTATDTAGNTSAAAGPSTTFVVDNTKPTVSIGAPSASITASSSVSYTVTYSDANFNTSTLTTGDITLNKTSTANGTIGLTGSGTSYTVTISSITGDGTLGISIGAGTASDLAGNTANAAGPSTTFIVDNTAPGIGIGSPSASSTRSGPITYTVTYSDTHFNSSTLSTGNITLNTTGTATGSLGVSGSGTTRTVTISSITGDGTLGISIASGTASDTAGNTAGAAGPSNIFTVDNTGPVVSSVTGPSNGSYKSGSQLNFTVNFAENVTVTGTPQIGLTIGSSSVNASYVSGTGTSALTFRYTVQNGDTDTDGIACASTITANGGAIKDSLGNPMTNFGLTAPNTSGVLVDTTAPTVVSITPPENGYYKAGQNLDFTVTWSENVIASGTPYISVQLDTSTVKANFLSGSGTTTHVFRYTVQAGDNDLTGIVVPTNPNTIHATGGNTLQDAAGNTADTTTSALSTSSIFVDTTAPTISSVTGPANGSYRAGTTLSFTATFSEKVNVTGTPYIGLTIGSTSRQAAYQSGSGTTALVFSYTVQGGETDTDGITSSSPVNLNSGTIQDLAGNNATLTFTPPNTTAVLVDTTVPVINSVTGPSNGSYNAGKNLDFTVNCSEVVNVSGTPYITLTVGATPVQASYVSGSGSSALVFRYTVQAGDTDTDGVLLSTSINLNGGSIGDLAGNSLYVGFLSPNTTGVLVDTTAPNAPIVSGISPDTGSSSTDGVTTNQNLKIFGTAEALSTVTITITPIVNPVIVPANALPLTVQADANGNWTNDYSSVTLSEGSYSITATATDAAGNVSPQSDSFTLVVDLTPPAAPQITSIDPDTGYSSSDGITSNPNITIYGTAEPDSSVVVTIDGNNLGKVTTDGMGNWHIFSETGLSEGGNSIVATATDVAGNVGSDSNSFTVTLDTTSPAINVSAPSTGATSSGPVFYTVSYSDANFYTSTLGTGDITLISTGNATGNVAVSGSGTNYTVTISNISGSGTLAISVGQGTASDTAGNQAPGVKSSTAFNVGSSVVGKVINVSATSSGWFHSGQTITLTVEFNTKVAVDTTSGTPSIALNSGGTAYYTGPSQVGRKILTFDYTVQQGENTQDLDELSVGALSLNGASIAVNNNVPNVIPFTPIASDVDTSLPAPGTIGSLAVNENIVIDTAGPTIAISDPSVQSTFTGPVTFTVTYTDKQFKSSSLSAGDVLLFTEGTATGTVGVDSGTGTNRTVTISNISGEGTIAIKIGPNTAVDIVGNQAGCSSVSTSFTVGPQLTILPKFVEPSIATPFDVVIGTTESNQITINGSPNTTYTVQYSTSIVAPTWLYLATVTTDGSGKAAIDDANDGSNQTRFYRTMRSLRAQ